MKMTASGADGVLGNLKLIREQIGKVNARAAIQAGAKVIADAVKERAPIAAQPPTPRSTALQPGELKADIKSRLRTESGQPVAYIGPGKKTAHVAGWVEYGRRMVKGGQSKVMANGKTRGKGVQVSDVAPKPFIRPGFESSVNEAIEASITEARKQLEATKL